MSKKPLFVLDDCQPEWARNNVPLCSEDCSSHDGKRCRLTGMRTQFICEPMVEEMADQTQMCCDANGHMGNHEEDCALGKALRERDQAREALRLMSERSMWVTRKQLRAVAMAGRQDLTYDSSTEFIDEIIDEALASS